MPRDDEPKVKELLAGGPAIDPALQRELERWFGLPSFEQLAEQGPPPEEDPELVAVRERRDRAIAAVDPGLLDRIHQRTEAAADRIGCLELVLDVHVDPDLALFDAAMAERGHTIAEPREVEIPDELREDLKDVTPQALLRDLHRAELDFDKQFEVVDVSEDQRLDVVAEVAAAMATSWQLPPLDHLPGQEGRALLAELREYLRRPWAELLATAPLHNRRIDEKVDERVDAP